MDSNFFRSLADRIEQISEEINEPDVIQINVPAFLRVIELVREEIKDDVPLHYLTEILAQLSTQGVVDMTDYDEIYTYTMQDADNTDNSEYEESDCGCNEPVEEAKKDKSPGKIDKDEDPCWKGYKMVGTKKKNGKEVPNCVPGKKGD